MHSWTSTSKNSEGQLKTMQYGEGGIGRMIRRLTPLIVLVAFLFVLSIALNPANTAPKVQTASESAQSAAVSTASEGSSLEAANSTEADNPEEEIGEEIADEDTPLAAELESRRTASVIGGNMLPLIAVGIIAAIAIFGVLTLRENRGISNIRRLR